ncbi:MAG: sulfite oxidase-like oxidoreductase [Desulfopila sp.]
MKTEQPCDTGRQKEDRAHSLRICGRVATPLQIDRAVLQTMDTIEANNLRLICGSGEPRETISHLSGVLLSDVINMAEVVIEDHNDTKKMYIIAASPDGYKAVFSWQEIFNSSVGEGVMIVLERDGKQLYQQGNAVDLVSSHDFLTGPRYVRQLESIEIVMVA